MSRKLVILRKNGLIIQGKHGEQAPVSPFEQVVLPKVYRFIESLRSRHFIAAGVDFAWAKDFFGWGE